MVKIILIFVFIVYKKKSKCSSWWRELDR